MPAGEDFDLCLWPPGTVDFSGHSSAIASAATYGDDPEAMKYVVPAGQGGIYYIDVWSIFTPADPNYWFTVNIQSPGGHASITAPAVQKNMRTGHSYTSYGTLKPLHLAGDQNVKVQWQKYSNGRWRGAGTMRPENIDYRSFTLDIDGGTPTPAAAVLLVCLDDGVAGATVAASGDVEPCAAVAAHASRRLDLLGAHRAGLGGLLDGPCVTFHRSPSRRPP